ncbi:MAG: lanthionine synthetase C family protein [Pseudonocardiaceae bacterium]
MNTSATASASSPVIATAASLRSQSLAKGAIGDALLHVERARSGSGTWQAVHAALTATTRYPLIATVDASLFFGTPAVGFVLHTAAVGTCRYTGALHTLDAQVRTLTRKRLDQAHARIDRGERPRTAEFDLFYGITGLGAYLLLRDPASANLHDVLSYLVRLTVPLTGDGEQLPGWWTAHDPTGGTAKAFPGGHGNLGMAHGIAGPLALLALAARRGSTVDGHIEAMTRICAWLDAQRQDTSTGLWWPPWVTLAEQRAHTVTQPGPLRPSWCYGTPGLARAQQLAGLALADTARQRMAEDSLLRCLADPSQLAQIRDASLCHGAAGLLHITHRVARDASDGAFTAHIPRLRALLLTQESARQEGLLEGVTGSALALYCDEASGIPATSWDACLLAG